jgi:two-component system chemotaxis response regulator CheB
VLVAQHMAPGFGRGLAEWLSQASGPRVIVALHGAPVLPAAVYLPPDGMDLEVGPQQELRVVPAAGRHVPSGDRLLASLARVYGSRAGGAVLTGMGEDGALGLRDIRQQGGLTLAQEEAECVVFGMPRAAVAAGATDRLLSISAIARAIVAASAPTLSSRPPKGEAP